MTCIVFWVCSIYDANLFCTFPASAKFTSHIIKVCFSVVQSMILIYMFIAAADVTPTKRALCDPHIVQSMMLIYMLTAPADAAPPVQGALCYMYPRFDLQRVCDPVQHPSGQPAECVYRTQYLRGNSHTKVGSHLELKECFSNFTKWEKHLFKFLELISSRRQTSY